jgi:hypothetical protein
MNNTYWQNNLDLVGSVQWNTPLGQCKVFNLPSPNFGVSASSINLGLSMSSTIQLELCWSFNMDIGFSNVTGMFLDVSTTNLISYAQLIGACQAAPYIGCSAAGALVAQILVRADQDFAQF